MSCRSGTPMAEACKVLNPLPTDTRPNGRCTAGRSLTGCAGAPAKREAMQCTDGSRLFTRSLLPLTSEV